MVPLPSISGSRWISHPALFPPNFRFPCRIFGRGPTSPSVFDGARARAQVSHAELRAAELYGPQYHIFRVQLPAGMS